jgi:hypothetical protein
MAGIARATFRRSMQKLRSFVRSCFAYLAAIYLFASFGTIPTMISVHSDAAQYGRQDVALSGVNLFLMGLSYLIFLIPIPLTAIFGAAWWTLKRGMPSARRWALAASFTMILSALPLLPVCYSMWKWEKGGIGGMGVIAFGLMAASLGCGVAGLCAYWRKQDLAADAPVKVAGDGTHWVLDVLFWGIQVVGLWWIIGRYSHWAREQHLPRAAGGGSYLDWILILLCVTLIHESAHAIVGVAVGMKLRSFTVGPFEFKEEKGHWRFHFRLTRILCFSGATGIISPEPDTGRWNEVAAIAAAPFANFLTGAVAAALVYAAPGSSWQSWWHYLALFASFSAVVFVSNLIPIQTGTSYSDGAHIYQLFGRGPASHFARAHRSVVATLVSPRRPADYDIAAIRSAMPHFTSGPRAMILHLWARDWCVDHGHREDAQREIAASEAIYDQAPAGIPCEYLYGIVIYEALLNRNAAGVRKYWAPIASGQTKESSFYWLAKCAVHWAENDGSAAQEALKRGLAHLNTRPDVGDNRFDRDQFRAMELLLEVAPSDASGYRAEFAADETQGQWLPAQA